jgi:two-component system, cell cycle response regulator DivK
MKTVLIVDATEYGRYAAAAALRGAGFVTVVAEGKDAAISALTQIIPSAVVIDLDLPDDDAIGLLQHIRERPQTRGVPVVACTAFGEHLLRREAEALGAHACRRKTPRGESELVQLVRKLTWEQVAGP